MFNNMTADGTKRVIVIKDIPSSFVEEAILILKDDPKVYDYERGQNSLKEAASPNKSILDEARKIIENYEKGCRRRARLKYAGIYGLRGYLNPVNFALAAGIIAAIFFLLKLH